MTTKPTSSSTASPASPAGGREQKDRPVRSVKVGSVQVAIWRNLTDDGREVFNATLERLYFDEKAEKWESSHSFGRRDMLELAKAVDVAHTVMSELHEHANRRVSARQPAASQGNAR
jgi:hypothetical protein